MSYLFLVVESLEKTSSSTVNSINDTKRNVLGIYDSFDRAYSEAKGYFNAIKIEDYNCKIYDLESIRSILYTSLGKLEGKVLVAKEENITYAPTDGSIWLKEIKNIYIEIRKLNQPIY